MSGPIDEKDYWEKQQDAAKINDYIGWFIGGLVIVPLLITLVPLGLNVSWDDSSGRLAAILLGWGIVSTIITGIISNYNCVSWGASSSFNDQCCRVGDGKEEDSKHPAGAKRSGCGEDTNLRYGKMILYLLPVIFSGMLFASMIISVNRGNSSGHSFLVFFIPAMLILVSQFQNFYIRIQEDKWITKTKHDKGNDGVVVSRYSAYAITLIWLATIGVIFSQINFGGKKMPPWASGYKMIGWIIFTIVYIFLTLIETVVQKLGGTISAPVDLFSCLLTGKKTISGEAC